MTGTKNFIELIKKEVKDVVVEICASGGHRLEPDMMSLANMGSFSDAHECVEGPIIAANMHRMIQPSMSQIWAVVKPEHDLKRTEYILATTFLGRFCLSGNILELKKWQWETVEAAISFYKSVKYIIRDGESFIYGNKKNSYINPVGWQIVIRKSKENNQVLVIAHTFDNSQKYLMKIKEDFLKDFQIEKKFGSSKICYDALSGELVIEDPESFTAGAILLSKQKRGA